MGVMKRREFDCFEERKKDVTEIHRSNRETKEQSIEISPEIRGRRIILRSG
ncbi:hypothetical protein Hdeb2414_s0227g00840581 [Helianthus debilis subsp. tardiflorus]